MTTLRVGDKVRRIKMTREEAVPIGFIGEILVFGTYNGGRNCTCDWNQPENPSGPTNYWVPIEDVELMTPDKPVPIPDLFLELFKDEEEPESAPETRRRGTKASAHI